MFQYDFSIGIYRVRDYQAISLTALLNRYALQHEYKLAHRYLDFALACDEPFTEEETYSVDHLYNLVAERNENEPELISAVLRVCIYATAEESAQNRYNKYFSLFSRYITYLENRKIMSPACRLSWTEEQAVFALARDAPKAWRTVEAPDIAQQQSSSAVEVSWRIGGEIWTSFLKHAGEKKLLAAAAKRHGFCVPGPVKSLRAERRATSTFLRCS